MTDIEQTKAFMEMLFRPGETFEVRVKKEGEKGAVQTWFQYPRIGQFAEVQVPIHTHNKRHIWVGVCPRDKPNSAAALHGRVLWVDFDSTVTTEERLDEALTQSGLPAPSMVVWSGNGYHAYWRLDGEYGPQVLRPYAKGLHSVLPSDSTHDPTRVMRVPGSVNWKRGESNPCRITRRDDNAVYPLDEFPKVTNDYVLPQLDEKPLGRGLGEEDFQLFVANWLDGQKHNIAVGVAGYLRKNLYQTKEQALDTIRRIHEEAGYSWPDDNLIKVVEDTYKQWFGKLAGSSKLAEFGVYPSVKDAFEYSFKKTKRPKSKISIIDFKEDIRPQEFWMEGLVGPGLVTLWAAEPKTGKSFAAMQIGHALTKGQDLWDFRVSGQHRVLYFQGELSKGMVADRAVNMFGIDAVRNPRIFGITDKPDHQIDLVREPEVLTDIAENYDVVIVDPISFFSGNDENSSVSVRETLSVFDALKAQGKAVILVHHTKKLQQDKKGNPLRPSFSDIRGSSAWFGYADALALQYRTGDSGNTMVKFMFRAAPEREPIILYRQEHGGFTDDKRGWLATNHTMSVSMRDVN